MPPVDDLPPPEDPTIEAELDRALEPYRDLLPAEMLAELRETLGDALATHPVGARLLERVKPPPVVVRSEETAKDGAVGEEGDDWAKGQAG
jgi:hypothetical protein